MSAYHVAGYLTGAVVFIPAGLLVIRRWKKHQGGSP